MLNRSNHTTPRHFEDELGWPHRAFYKNVGASRLTEVQAQCPVCFGTGASSSSEPGLSSDQCDVCGGAGWESVPEGERLVQGLELRRPNWIDQPDVFLSNKAIAQEELGGSDTSLRLIVFALHTTGDRLTYSIQSLASSFGRHSVATWRNARGFLSSSSR